MGRDDPCWRLWNRKLLDKSATDLPITAVLQYCHMRNTLTIRLPQELLERLRRVAGRNGLPVGQVVRESLEKTLSGDEDSPLLKFAGVIKGGPRDLSSRKGFSRK